MKKEKQTKQNYRVKVIVDDVRVEHGTVYVPEYYDESTKTWESASDKYIYNMKEAVKCLQDKKDRKESVTHVYPDLK